MNTFRRRMSALWAVLDDSQTANHNRKRRWEEQRSKQLELFVSEIQQTLLVMNELETEEDRIAFLVFLKSEIDSHAPAYSEQQLSIMQKAYDDFYQAAESDALVTTPLWFIPWYELVVDKTKSLGAGGFGDVYRARWLDSEVVVKQVKHLDATMAKADWSTATSTSSWRWSVRASAITKEDGVEERKKMRDMFEREVGVWFGLSHPHVVRLFGACHVGTPFFACEYARNGSLDKYLRKHPEELWQKLHEAALGVQYLHARGIVHDDLKCNNIVVGSDGKAKVTDFGLSSDAVLQGEEKEAGGQLSGAWQWVAPECLEHGASHLSFASDVYALGMCVVEALRVVELTQMEEEERPPCPPSLPWGDFENAVVKTYVVRRQELPMRPQLCTDAEWELVARMCAHDPTKRIKISTVVKKLAEFARAEKRDGSDTYTNSDASTAAHTVLAIVAEMKRARRSVTHDAASSSREVLHQIYDLLWDRLDHLSSAIEDGPDDAECLRKLVKSAQERTIRLHEHQGFVTPFFFTEAALQGYALHRDLDEVIDANFWCFGGDCGKIHDWKARCLELLGLVGGGK